ncbi:DUF3427 domain-containing protein [Flaviflexus huanghaiensis]|uniref:DUF3427 domain-containing protein n=1 Tax=Flaviflexus huanghaiensis TaxID=1111473 RepID=UPI0015FB62A0|nr:DUF3427 domain-containing protein [Flaviflexus huanghaiensis]
MNDIDRATMPYGLYELVESRALPVDYFPPDALAEWNDVEEAERIKVLSTYVAQRLEHQLRAADKTDRVSIINSLLSQFTPRDEILWTDAATGRFRQLTSLRPEGARPLSQPVRPLSDVSLLTNGPNQPSFNKEISQEMASADRVDLLCSFLKLSGINVVRKALEDARRRAVPLRVIATTYMGATDAKAVHELHELGAEVKISYQNASTRLHAKAWLFERDSGFSTGYVGSSNLSAAAMTDGLEWNVRVSTVLTPGVLAQFRAAFDGYWNDPEFVTYSPEQYGELENALRHAGSSAGERRQLAAVDTSFLEVFPRPHQSLMLDHLASERSHGRHDNLVVAATGTGKAILSALDYRNLTEVLDRPTLLFVAHRHSILNQARNAFRAVLRRREFGEMLVGGQQPEDGRYVFASVQSLSRGWLREFRPDHFDFVIIDEFHHAEASTYRAVLDYLEPKELVGLTATPERADGVDVAEEFFDGRVATELRLWDALDADLLVPFHYFGISDGTDLRTVRVRQGAYDPADLDDLYMDDSEGGQGRTRLRVIFEELNEKIADPQRMKALGFCVSKKHARFMAEVFNRAGIGAVSLVGDDPEPVRESAVTKLLNPDDPLAVIFTVDIFNEGIDIPEVDTLLMLRPTQSPTLFQQQLGRGLRRAPRKSVLTVLDFVGNQSDLYRFERKYGAFARGERLSTAVVEEGFPDLPPGCNIELDQFTCEQIVAGIKQSLQVRTNALVDEVRDFAIGRLRPKLVEFLDATGRDFGHIYGRRVQRGVGASPRQAFVTWKYLLAHSTIENDLLHLFQDDQFVEMNNRIVALLHVNDRARQRGYLQLLRGTAQEADMTDVERRLAWMLAYSVWLTGKFSGASQKFTLDEALHRLRRYPAITDELEQVWQIVADRDRRVVKPVPQLEGRSPLLTHGTYSREELFAGLALHETSGRAPGSAVEGVIESRVLDAIALLVTLEKTEKHYSPQTMYKDYAVTEREFAWDSQNATTPDSPLGLMYQGLGEQRMPLLFVRRSKPSQTIPGATEPYTFLGPVQYVRHEGSQPMHVTWHLERPMPAELFNIARVAA